MPAITTVSGHVSRALDFYNNTEMWIALAHPFDWNIARLQGYNLPTAGVFTFAGTETLEFTVDGVEVSVPSWTAGAYSNATLVADINAAAVSADISLLNMASLNASGRILLTSPTTTTGSIEITSGSETLGFFTGDYIAATAGGTSVPSPDPTQRRLMEPFAYEKITVTKKALVKSDPDIYATVISTNQGNTFDTSVASSANTFEFKVDGSATITVVFPDSASTSIAVVLNYINTAANLVSVDFASVATLDGTVSPPRVKLTSPTAGAAGSIEIVTASPVASMDIPAGTTLGVDGGSYKFRNDQFTAVLEADAYVEGTRLVYVEAEFAYDEVPTTSWTQIGLITDLTMQTGVPGTRTYLTEDEVLDIGILEYLEHRQLTARSIDQKELIRLVIEF